MDYGWIILPGITPKMIDEWDKYLQELMDNNASFDDLQHLSQNISTKFDLPLSQSIKYIESRKNEVLAGLNFKYEER